MGMRKLKIKIFLKNTFYRKSNGYLMSQLKVLSLTIGGQNVSL